MLAIGILLGWWLFDWSITYFFALVLVSFAVKMFMSFNMRYNYFLQAINSGKSTGGGVALTFDDGPVVEKTSLILDILKEKNVPAAFFCIGKNVVANPDLVKRMNDEGHIVGNHSYVHGKLFSLQSARTMVKEIVRTDAAITNLTRKKPRYFRPPYGVTNPNVAAAATHTGHKVIGWNVRSLDTVTQSKEILWRRITKSVKAGDIVLFHDTSSLTIELLPDYIDHLKKSGLKIVRLDELINQQAYA